MQRVAGKVIRTCKPDVLQTDLGHDFVLHRKQPRSIRPIRLLIQEPDQTLTHQSRHRHRAQGGLRLNASIGFVINGQRDSLHAIIIAICWWD